MILVSALFFTIEFLLYFEPITKSHSSFLKRSMPFLRSQLAKKMTTRGIPKLHFVYDKTIDESMKISRLLDGVLNANNK